MKISQNQAVEMSVSAECTGTFNELRLTLSIRLDGQSYTRIYDSRTFVRDCSVILENRNEELDRDLTNILNVIEGNIQHNVAMNTIVCEKHDIFLQVSDTQEITNILKTTNTVACPK